ncbi:MAG: methyltransferase domain-containing protein [Minisyncoccia bacterium]
MDKKYFQIEDFVRQIFAGKTIWRISFNQYVKTKCSMLSGKVLDLASGGTPSYSKYLPQNIELVRTDSIEKDGVERCVDFNKPLPFTDNEFDSVLFFNALYIAEDRIATLKEIRRILNVGGILYLSMPFIFAEIPEPVDYCRLTYQGLEKELREAGFSHVKILRFGERFTSAANLLHPFFIFNTIRLVVYVLSIILDRMTPQTLKNNHPAPLGYFCIAPKDVN